MLLIWRPPLENYSLWEGKTNFIEHLECAKPTSLSSLNFKGGIRIPINLTGVKFTRQWLVCSQSCVAVNTVCEGGNPTSGGRQSPDGTGREHSTLGWEVAAEFQDIFIISKRNLLALRSHSYTPTPSTAPHPPPQKSVYLYPYNFSYSGHFIFWRGWLTTRCQPGSSAPLCHSLIPYVL